MGFSYGLGFHMKTSSLCTKFAIQFRPGIYKGSYVYLNISVQVLMLR